MNIFHCSQLKLAGVVTAAVALTLIAPQTVLAQTVGLTDTFFGTDALHDSVAGFPLGYSRSAFGNSALYHGVNASDNTAVGVDALFKNTDGSYNTAIGEIALENTTGSENTAVGSRTLVKNDTGNQNTANGARALFANVSGWGNTAIGYNSLSANISGHSNVALGYGAGSNLKGSNNAAIGNDGDSGDNNTIRIGTNQGRAFIAGIYGKTVAHSIPVLVNTDGQLYTSNSPQKNASINTSLIDGVSDKLLQLRPVSFLYKVDKKNKLQYGLVAEEVAKVYPELVQYDHEGKPVTVYYHFLAPLLLSELQKEHQTLAAQQMQLTDMHAAAVQQQTKLEAQDEQLGAQHAEMLALLQQKQQQYVTEMASLLQKVNQLDNVVQANTSRRSSEKMELAVTQ